MTLRALVHAVGGLAVAVAVLACSRPQADGFAMASVDDVEKFVGQPGVKIFDVNTPESFQSGHVPGAVFVDPKTLASALPQDKSARLVFYCKNPH